MPSNEVVTDTKLLREKVNALAAAIETGAGTDAISPNIIDAKGDIVVGTADNTPSVIAVGSSGQVLSSDPTTPTGMRWVTPTSGGGSGGVAGVSSVNGRVGDVTLTRADVSLSNVDNTSDFNKPVSSATQSALNAKADSTTVTTHINSTANPHSTTKTQVGLGNVDNTSDAAKPVSTATQAALDLKANVTALASKADLVGGKVPSSQLPVGGTGVQVWEWYVDTATQGLGSLKRFNDSGQELTIVSVRVRANINPPSGQDLIVDLNKNGNTLFVTQSNRPRIFDGTQDSGPVTALDTTSVASGDYLVPDIDQVGSIVPGSGVLVSVTLR